MQSVSAWWLWILFFFIISLVISIDLFWLHGDRRHRVSMREAIAWSTAWVVLALIFNAIFWWYLSVNYNSAIAYQKSLEFFVSYLIEKSLSVDNLFVFIVIFHYFSIPPEQQRKLLLYGVISAVFLRLIIILSGIWLLDKFNWIFYIFGVLLLVSALRLLWIDNEKDNLDNNFIIKSTARLFRISRESQGERFFFIQDKLLYITPLLMALIFIEISDLIFAIDSIPAVFAITRDPFIAFTSNVFAIMGLRAMYFLIANAQEQFYFLRHGLAVILVFIATKMLLHNHYDIPIALTLGFIVLVLAISIGLSIYIKRPKP